MCSVFRFSTSDTSTEPLEEFDGVLLCLGFMILSVKVLSLDKDDSELSLAGDIFRIGDRVDIEEIELFKAFISEPLKFCRSFGISETFSFSKKTASLSYFSFRYARVLGC